MELANGKPVSDGDDAESMKLWEAFNADVQVIRAATAAERQRLAALRADGNARVLPGWPGGVPPPPPGRQAPQCRTARWREGVGSVNDNCGTDWFSATSSTVALSHESASA